VFEEVVCETSSAVCELDVCACEGLVVRGDVVDCWGVGLNLCGAGKEEGWRQVVDMVAVSVVVVVNCVWGA